MIADLIAKIPKPLLIWIQTLKEKVFHGYRSASYSGDGIDRVLSDELNAQNDIFYVDVGANHPFWHSNTYLFYLQGARGINIDATPGLMSIFDLSRPRDKNIEVAISTSRRRMRYLTFDIAAYNGFEGTFDEERIKYITPNKKLEITPQRLSRVLDTHLPKGQRITVLFVDTEGHDLKVLQSNDWKKYSPRYIVTEHSARILQDIFETKLYRYLHNKGYEAVATTRANILFKKTQRHKVV